jgi:hypothetical protein
LERQVDALERQDHKFIVASQAQELFASADTSAQPQVPFVIGNKYGPLDNSKIKRSTYTSSTIAKNLRKLIEHPQADILYLLGVKYRDSVGGDVQAGISETSHYYETPIQNALRGVREELHISLSSLEELESETYTKKRKKTREEITHTKTHYSAQIQTGHYHTVQLRNIHPNPLDDDDTCSANVYLYGFYDDLLPILKAYEPPNPKRHPKHDKIDALCMIPFSQLESFC